jgi:predicted metal-binding membrane protein
MAAMMFPSVAPTVALYSVMTKSGSLGRPFVFTSGYLAAWTGIGVVAFVIANEGGRVSGDLLAWDRGGRWVAGATLIVAAVYELTPLKDACLGKCRSPLGFLLGAWRTGRLGAFEMGAKHGAWCIGCCWALMASLFALGVMSLVWMAVVAGLITLEKLVPWRRVALAGTTGVLAVLGVLLLATPGALPGLTTPGTGPMPGMSHMSKTGNQPMKQPIQEMPASNQMPDSTMPAAGKMRAPSGPAADHLGP